METKISPEEAVALLTEQYKNHISRENVESQEQDLKTLELFIRECLHDITAVDKYKEDGLNVNIRGEQTGKPVTLGSLGYKDGMVFLNINNDEHSIDGTLIKEPEKRVDCEEYREKVWVRSIKIARHSRDFVEKIYKDLTEDEV